MAKELRRNSKCLNCELDFSSLKLDVDPAYCPSCGQENTSKRLSLGILLKDFLDTYFSFDSKLFKTLYALILKPGELTKNVLNGKRQRYLPPVRLFFVIGILLFSVISMWVLRQEGIHGSMNEEIEKKVNEDLLSKTENSKDSLAVVLSTDEITEEEGDTTEFYFRVAGEDKPVDIVKVLRVKRDEGIDAAVEVFREDHDWADSNMGGIFIKQLLKTLDAGQVDIVRLFFAGLPISFLLAIPFLALFFKLLYIRRKFLFIDHIVFFLHLHSFVFLILLIVFLLSISFPSAILSFAVLPIVIYGLVSMKKIYDQSWPKTLLKGSFFFFLIYPLSISFVALFTLFISFLIF